MSHIVLNFHGLGEPHDKVPVQEQPYWLDFADFGALLDRIWTEHDPEQFAFTFDDGNISDLRAAEMLAARGVTGRFFVLAGRLGQEHYLSAEDLRDISSMGMIVGLHGRYHVDWRTCGLSTLDSEINDARCELAVALAAPIDEVAIPYGRYNRTVLQKLRKSGFRRIHTSDGGLASLDATIWPRNTLRSDMTEDELAAILGGRWSRARNLLRACSGFMKSWVA